MVDRDMQHLGGRHGRSRGESSGQREGALPAHRSVAKAGVERHILRKAETNRRALHRGRQTALPRYKFAIGAAKLFQLQGGQESFNFF
jgi:hypothetical protein